MSRHGSNFCRRRMSLYITWLTRWKGKTVDKCFPLCFWSSKWNQRRFFQKYEALRMHWYPAYQPLLYVWKNRRQPKTFCIFGRFACHNFTCTHLRGPDLNWVSKMSHWLHENGVYIIVRCAIHPHSVFCDLQRLVFFFFLLFFHFRFVRHFIPLSSLKTLCVSREIKSFCYVQDLRLKFFKRFDLSTISIRQVPRQ